MLLIVKMYCSVCLETSYQKCSGCNVVYYCSTVCQAKDHKFHKEHCQSLILLSALMKKYNDSLIYHVMQRKMIVTNDWNINIILDLQDPWKTIKGSIDKALKTDECPICFENETLLLVACNTCYNAVCTDCCKKQVIEIGRVTYLKSGTTDRVYETTCCFCRAGYNFTKQTIGQKDWPL